MSENYYPTTLLEAVAYFSDADRAHEFMTRMRWPVGVRCPRCRHGEHYFIKSRRVWRCKDCGRQFSVKTGTIMESSPLGLDKWLAAFWLIANAKNGISSYEIARALGITQKSAWFVGHRVRHALATGSVEILSGDVEVDEASIGPVPNKINRAAKARREQKPEHKRRTSFVTAVERGGAARSKTVEPVRHELHGHIHAHVEPGSTVHTDENSAYDRLEGFERTTVNHSAGEYVRGEAGIQSAENYNSLFKRCVKGTWICPSGEHLDAYLAEQDFRYGKRKADDGLRAVSVASSVSGKRLTYRECKKNTGRGPARGYDWRNHRGED